MPRRRRKRLLAYAIGLLPFVLIRSLTATFLARGDTATPVKAALTAVGVNVVFKFLLMAPLAQVGLALATSIGAWINFVLVVWFAGRAGHLAIDPRLRSTAARLGAAGCVLACVLWLAQGGVERLWPAGAILRDEKALAALAFVGAVTYAVGPLPCLARNGSPRAAGRASPPTPRMIAGLRGEALARLRASSTRMPRPYQSRPVGRLGSIIVHAAAPVEWR